MKIDNLDLGQLEAALEELIRKHGMEKLRRAFTPLIGTVLNWPDWQRVTNLAERINRRIQNGRANRPNRQSSK